MTQKRQCASKAQGRRSPDKKGDESLTVLRERETLNAHGSGVPTL
jgi:hypothetical protein